jgi:hypothetical protein
MEGGAPGALGQLAPPAVVAAVLLLLLLLRPQLLPSRRAAASQDGTLPRLPRCPGVLRLEHQQVQQPHLQRACTIG